jgi:hypothetical protein
MKKKRKKKEHKLQKQRQLKTYIKLYAFLVQGRNTI